MEPERAQAVRRGRTTVRDLDRTTRGLVLLIGLAGLLGGGIAVFMSDNQAGTVALLTVGVVALLLAIVGKVPLRWVIGGNEFDMSEEEAVATVEVVADQLSPTETAELARRLANSDLASRNPTTSAMLDYVAFEQTAIARIMLAISPRGWSWSSDAGRGLNRRFDGLVQQGDRVVPVILKRTRAKQSFWQLIRQIRDLEAATPISSGVVIVVSDLPDSVRARMDAELEPMGAELVDLSDREFDQRFVEACDKVARKGDS